MVDGDRKKATCIMNMEIVRRGYVQCKQGRAGQSKEGGFCGCLRGCICFLGGDCIIEEVTFEQRDYLAKRTELGERP